MLHITLLNVHINKGGKFNPRKEATDLIGKVDGCSVELGLQVVDVGSQENEGNHEDANEDGGGLVGLGSNLGDDTILADNLDSSNVVAGVLVGLVNVSRGSKSGFALSGSLVDLFAHLNNFVFVIGIISFVVVFSRFFTRHAVHGDQTVVRVGEASSSHVAVSRRTSVVVGEGSACVIGEKTKVDSSTLFSAVGSHVVFNLLLFKLTVVLVEIGLLTLNGILEVELLFLLILTIFFVGVSVGTDILNSVGNVTVVLADIGIEIVSLVVVVIAVTDHFLGVLAPVLIVVIDGIKVGLQEGVHVDDVVTVSFLAATGTR